MSDVNQNKEIVRQFFEQIWNQGDESAIDRFIAEDAIGNDPKFGVGRESFRAQWRKWRIAFPDINFAIQELVAENDVVVSRWLLTGTHLGQYLNKPATGKKISVDGVSIDRLKNGMVVSGFDAWDSQVLAAQIS
ncbi:MAG: ester cyclase [Actinobacteria bacterium]|nr:ester cyclase [Actinomycetota bacterium]